MSDLHEDEYLDRHDIRKRQLSGLLNYLAIVLIIIGFGVVALQNQATVNAIRETQTEGSPTTLRLIDIAEDIKRIAVQVKVGTDQIISCTTPKGECAQENKKTTAKFSTLFLVGTACAAGFADLGDTARIEATQNCVSNWLADHSLSNLLR